MNIVKLEIPVPCAKPWSNLACMQKNVMLAESPARQTFSEQRARDLNQMLCQVSERYKCLRNLLGEFRLSGVTFCVTIMKSKLDKFMK